VDAWICELFDACVTDVLAYEYADVLSNKLNVSRWEEIQPALTRLLELAQFVVIRFTWRPISPDPNDDHVIDCAMAANGVIVTNNLRDFVSARENLGLKVLSAEEFVAALIE
jgi:predicted nucleic acid-binding protein